MNILLKSLVSAAVTALLLTVAKFSSPKLAGAIGGLPVVFAVSYILLTFNNRSPSRDFLIGGIYGAIASIFFSILLLWLNAVFVKTYWVNFTSAYILAFLSVLGFVYFTSHR